MINKFELDEKIKKAHEIIEHINITSKEFNNDLYDKFGITYYLIKIYDKINELCILNKDFDKNYDTINNMLKEIIKTSIISLVEINKEENTVNIKNPINVMNEQENSRGLPYFN